MKKWKIHVVPHTHWDREWYFSQSQANTLFNHNLTEIIKVLNNNSQFKNFVLDGQVSILDDYLASSSNDRAALVKLALANKLLLGPWYSQPDMFNSLGESIIRNLEYGINIANDLGRSITSAYLPDSFGFNINLPQIFNYFALKNMIFWRGMKKEDNDQTVYFNWKGIDGSEIPTYCLQHGYWVFGGVFPYNKINAINYQAKTPKILADLLPFLKTIKDRSPDELAKNILLPFGGDEGPIINDLPLVINELNKIDPDHEWIISNFDQFFANVEKPNYEINTSLHWPYLARIHRTIASSRYDLKNLFRQCEIKLYYELEPLTIMYRQFQPTYNNQRIIDEVMKKILVSQAHDSLGNCNSDGTNKDIFNRLTQAHQMIMMEIAIIKKKIFHQLNLDAKTDILCFNLAPYARVITLDSKITSTQKMITSNDRNFVLKIKKITKRLTTLEYNPYYEFEVAIKTPLMQPLSYQVFKINHHNGAVKLNQNFTNIIGDPDNHLWIHRHCIRYINKHLSLDDFINILPYDDFGDSYDFSPNPQNQKTTKISALNKITKNITTLLYHLIELDHVVTYQNNKSQTFKIIISKWYGETYKIKVKTNNKSQNTKWVINFNFETEFNLSDVYATQSNSLTSRANFSELDWVKKGYKEFPCPITTNDNAILIPQFDNFTLLTRGNNEFQVVDNSLEVTLFRSYGFIGNKDLVWRPGRPSGIHLATPDAQLQKELVFDFGFSFNDQQTAKLVNSWNFESGFYYDGNLDDLEFSADRFVINYDQTTNVTNIKLANLKINANLLISSLRYIDQIHIELRIANLKNQAQTFDLKINNKNINFAFKKQFSDLDYQFNQTSIVIESQKIVTIIFTLPKIKIGV